MAKFRPYHDLDLNCEITTPAEEKLKNRILSMEYDELETIRHDINTTIQIYPNIPRTNDFIIKRRCFFYRTNELRKAGRLHPATTMADIGDGIRGFMVDYIITDEFWKRF